MGKSKTETKAAAFPAKPRKKKDPYYLRAVGKALEALEILRRSPGALSLAEMASRLHLTKSSTLRVLHTLEVSRHLRKSAPGTCARQVRLENRVGDASVLPRHFSHKHFQY